MGFIEPSTIHQLAESLTVPKLSKDAAKALAPHIDVRLREIVQEACKFARHSKRVTLKTEDINNALRLRNCEPLHGFATRDPFRFVRAAGHPDLFYVEDSETSIQKVAATPLPRVPIEVGVVPHWLAIEGIQPRIPENAPVERPKLKRPRVEAAIPKKARQKLNHQSPLPASQEAKPESQASTVLPPVRLVISLELLKVFENLKEVIQEARALPETAPGGPFAGLPVYDAGKSLADANQRELQFLCREKQWTKNTRATTLQPEVSGRLERERHALQCLAFDPGQHALAPPTIELIAEQVRSCMKQLPQLHLLIKVARSMLKNPEIEIERYLDKLLSPLMTCILTKRLGATPSEDHWAVRSAAADVIADICSRFGERFPNVPVRIVKQYVNAFMDASKALPCHYGAIVGLTKMGHRTVQLMLLPYVQPYLKRLEPALDVKNPNAVQKAEAAQVLGALQHACAGCMYASMSSRLSKDFFGQLQGQRKPLRAAKLDFKATPDNVRPAANPGKKAAAQRLAKKSSRKQGDKKNSGSGPLEREGAAKAQQPIQASKSLAEQKAGLKGKEGGNGLEDAWRENGQIGKHLLAVHELFGDAVQPYAPLLPISQVFL